MTKQLGRAMLVEIGDGAGTEVFAALCGLNSKALTINNTSIDVTTPDCTTPEGVLWRDSLAGLKALSVSGDGYFEDSVTELRANTIAMQNDNQANFIITIPNFGTYTGAFRIVTLEFGGETEGGVSYSISLENVGAVVFATI